MSHIQSLFHPEFVMQSHGLYWTIFVCFRFTDTEKCSWIFIVLVKFWSHYLITVIAWYHRVSRIFIIVYRSENLVLNGFEENCQFLPGQGIVQNVFLSGRKILKKFHFDFLPFYWTITFSDSFHRMPHIENPQYKIDCPRGHIAAICLKHRKRFPKIWCY